MAFNVTGQTTIADLRSPQQAPRSTEFDIYLILPQDTQPASPGTGELALSTYVFLTDTLTLSPALAALWQRDPVDTTTSTDRFWRQRIRITEDTFQSSNVAIANIGTPVGTQVFPATIQSDNFQTGVRGWSLNRNDGTLEAQGATISGNVTANALTANVNIGSPTITGGTIQTSTSGARIVLDDDGLRLFDANGIARIIIGDLS